MKQKLLNKLWLRVGMIVAIMTTALAGTAWADTATITFANQTSGTSDGSSAYSTSTFVSSGIDNSDAAFGTITCSATAKCYSGKTGYGLKAGASSSAGSFTIAFSTPITNVTKITLNRASYSSSKTADITVKNGEATLAEKVSTPSGSADFADMDITGLSIASLSGLTVETSRYCYIKSITVTYSTGSSSAVATTTAIDHSGIINTDVYVGTAAGSLSATVKDNNNTVISGASVTWSSSNENVAKVASNGTVTLVAAGKTTITANYAGVSDEYQASSDTYEMTVTDSSPVETFVFSELGYANAADVTTVSGTDVTLTFAAGTNTQNSPKYYTSGFGVRMYNGNTLTIASEKKIASIEFTFDGSNTTLALASGQTGTLSDANNSIRTWTGSSNSIVFTTTATNRIKKIKVAYENENLNDPELSYATTSYTVEGGSSFATPSLVNPHSLTVTYSSSNTDIATVNAETGAVTIGNTPGTVTITATFEGNDIYSYGSASYTITVEAVLQGLAALTALTEEDDYVVRLTDALVTYVHGTNAYIQDANGAVVLYGCAGTFAAGDKISGKADVHYKVYNNLPEVTAITLEDGYTKTTGNTVEPEVVTIETLNASFTNYISRYVKIEEATVTSAFSNRNSIISQNSNTIVLRDQNNPGTLETTVDDIVTVTAHPAIYNSNKQIYVYEQSQIVVAKENPTITFNDGSVRVGQDLDLSTLFTSNSAGAVTYSITAGGSYATLVGSTLTGTAEGSVTVKAEQAESSSYNAGEATATITVNPALVLSSIAVTTAPTKTTYNEGETFDPTGMVVTATYSDNSTDAVTSYTYSPNGALATSDTEITISYTESGVTKTTTQAITVNEVVDYAELPFAYDGNGSGTLPVGLTQSGLGTYTSSPAMKFDSTGDELILKINERPGVLTFDIKNNSFSGGTFKVQTSEDGVTYTDLKVYSTITGTQNEEFTNLDANVRYIKWVYTTKSSGNVALGNIELDEYVYIPPVINAESPVALAFNATEGEIPYTIKNPVGGVNLTATENADWISGIAVAADKVTFTTTANEGEARSATITLSYTGAEDKEVTVTQAAYVPPFESTTWTLATSITSGKHYIIVGMNDDDAYAMGEQKTNNRAGEESVTVSGTTATVSSAAVQEFVIYGPDASGNYTIYDADAKGYLYAAGSDKNYLKTETELDENNNGVWAISFNATEGSASVVAQGANTHNVMRFNYNNGTPLFACYASTSTTGSSVYLYEKAGEATPTESKTLNASGYASYASQNALDFTNADGFTAWAVTAISGTTITFSQITGSVPAGTGMLLKGTPSGSATMTSATGATALTSNLLIGTTADFTVENVGDYYGLKGASFVPVAKSTVPAGKALLPKAAVEGSGVKALTFIFEDDATGISLMEDGRSQMEDGVIYNLAGQRISKMQKGINIVNGKKILK